VRLLRLLRLFPFIIMSSTNGICTVCAGSVRGTCSRPTPHCLRCCRLATLQDSFLCPRHVRKQASVVDSLPSQQQHDEQAEHDSAQGSSSDSDYEPEPASDSDCKSDASQSEGTADDDIPSRLKEPRPSIHRMQKALAKVKPWQKGVVQDGLVITCRAFLMQFENSLEMVNADSQDFMRMIPLWLVGEAALWFDNLKQSNSPCLRNWPAFREALLLTYGDLPPTHTAWEAVQTCFMRDGESIESHCDRFRNKVVDLCNRIPTWLTFEIYIRMMRPDTRRHLYSVFYDKIQLGERATGISLDVISRAAIHYERSIAPSTFTLAPVSVPVPVTSYPPLPVAAPAQQSAQTASSTSQPVGPTSSQRRQWKKDHNKKRPRESFQSDEQDEKKEGEKPAKHKDLSHIICWNCSKPGHYKNQCAETPLLIKQEGNNKDRSKSKGGG
jgi:hypothetical protein